MYALMIKRLRTTMRAIPLLRLVPVRCDRDFALSRHFLLLYHSYLIYINYS